MLVWIAMNQIEVVYQGCDTSFTHPVTEEKKREVRAKYQLPEHYIINVGSIEERKNALSAVQALTMLPEQIHLVIVGRHTEYTDKIERLVHSLIAMILSAFSQALRNLYVYIFLSIEW